MQGQNRLHSKLSPCALVSLGRIRIAVAQHPGAAIDRRQSPLQYAVRGRRTSTPAPPAEPVRGSVNRAVGREPARPSRCRRARAWSAPPTPAPRRARASISRWDLAAPVQPFKGDESPVFRSVLHKGIITKPTRPTSTWVVASPDDHPAIQFAGQLNVSCCVIGPAQLAQHCPVIAQLVSVALIPMPQ